MADGLATANATIGSVATAEADVADIRQRVEDLNLEQLQPGTLAVSSGTRVSVAGSGAQLLQAR